MPVLVGTSSWIMSDVSVTRRLHVNAPAELIMQHDVHGHCLLMHASHQT